MKMSHFINNKNTKNKVLDTLTIMSQGGTRVQEKNELRKLFNFITSLIYNLCLMSTKVYNKRCVLNIFGALCTEKHYHYL
jgi:hypothetical protein